MRNWNRDRLMVSGSIDRRKFVRASREASNDIGSQLSVTAAAFKPLKKAKFLGLVGVV